MGNVNGSVDLEIERLYWDDDGLELGKGEVGLEISRSVLGKNRIGFEIDRPDLSVDILDLGSDRLYLVATG